MATVQIRLKKRETPKGQIECPIGGTVKPSVCLLCAFTNNCPSYKAFLEEDRYEDQYEPDKDSEALLIEPLQIRLRLREIYWKLRAKLSECKDWLRYIWKRLKEDVDMMIMQFRQSCGLIIAFTPMAFFMAIALLILLGILKVHIEF